MVKGVNVSKTHTLHSFLMENVLNPRFPVYWNIHLQLFSSKLTTPAVVALSKNPRIPLELCIIIGIPRYL
jgi:hypothetical protein